MNIEYLPHTADIRMRIKATSLKELFLLGLLGMGNILKNGFCEGQLPFDQKFTINLSAQDMTGLLIDFLSEVLSISYTEKMIFCKAEFLVLEKNTANIEIYGRHVGILDEEIKAVTYHEAEVRKSKGYWETIVVFDI